jgi:pimeloyl-ACP methyl ester carboxylesterase
MHQQHLKALITMASEGRQPAADLYKLFTDMVLMNARADVAHLILYPYATAELLYRYSRLNGSIMSTDVSHVLGKVTRPALVVTSEDDSTAHPAGSMRVAERLPDATLRVEAHGDHLSLFDAEPHVTELAARFISAETGRVSPRV